MGITKFESKRSWILISLVYLLIGGGLAIVWTLPYYKELIYKIPVTVALASIIAIFTWAIFSTYYLLTDSYIFCVSGPFKFIIHYSKITNIRPSKSGWSSCALSFDRVLIEQGPKFFRRSYISPVRKEAFMKELNERIEKYKNIKLDNKT